MEIIPQFVSDKNELSHCRGDDFFRGKHIDFLKIDVDGGERPLLDGFSEMMNSSLPLKIALCTYHRQEDKEEFTAYFEKRGFSVSHSRRYMIFYHDKMIAAPYLRRGLIRAVR